MAGEPVPDRGLRWAYSSLLDRLAETIDREGGSGDALDRAEAIVAANPSLIDKAGRLRQMRRRFPARGDPCEAIEPVESIMCSVWTNTLLVPLGGTPATDGLSEVATAYGVNDGADLLSAIGAPPLQVDVEALHEALPELTLTELAATARSVALPHLDEARILFLRLAAFADNFSVVLGKTAGVHGGLGLGTLPRPSADPGLQALCVLALAGSPSDLEAVSLFLAEIKLSRDLFGALRGLIDAIPPDLVPLLHPRKLETAQTRNPQRVAAFEEALRSYCEANRDHAEILLSEPHTR
jgi:hypothetical protein